MPLGYAHLLTLLYAITRGLALAEIVVDATCGVVDGILNAVSQLLA